MSDSSTYSIYFNFFWVDVSYTFPPYTDRLKLMYSNLFLDDVLPLVFQGKMVQERI